MGRQCTAPNPACTYIVYTLTCTCICVSPTNNTILIPRLFLLLACSISITDALFNHSLQDMVLKLLRHWSHNYMYRMLLPTTANSVFFSRILHLSKGQRIFQNDLYQQNSIKSQLEIYFEEENISYWCQVTLLPERLARNESLAPSLFDTDTVHKVKAGFILSHNSNNCLHTPLPYRQRGYKTWGSVSWKILSLRRNLLVTK